MTATIFRNAVFALEKTRIAEQIAEFSLCAPMRTGSMTQSRAFDR